MKRALVLVMLAAVVLTMAATGASQTNASRAGVKVNPIPGIRSPSRNIRCLFVPAPPGGSSPNLLCSIGQADYSAALQHRCATEPAGLDWHGFELPATRKGGVTCSGGILYDPSTQRPTYSTLPYGKTWRHGPFTCTSRVTGVTCTNTGGHGLFISRQSWRAY
jgi:Family of unknown function (DUF6636)